MSTPTLPTRARLEWRALDRPALVESALPGLLWGLIVLNAFARPFMPIDETRYISVAWEMWRDHSWWVAHMNGTPYADKPPLLFWLINLGWQCFGVSVWWPKLISPLASLLGGVHLYRFARRLGHTRHTARQAVLILMSMLLWSLYSGALMFDVLLTACLLGALVPLIRGELTRHRMLESALWLGLALLAKGPVALLTWLSVALSMPLWRTSPLGSGGRVRLWLSLAGAVAMLLGWALISAWHGGPAYADQLLWHQSVDRLGQTADHARPFWWYLPVLPALLFPWALWPQAWPFWRRSALIPTERPRLRRRRLPWIWAGALLLMFSMIGGKQIHYLMPMLPATALIIADTLHRRTQSATVTLRLIALSLAILALTIIALSLLQPEGSGAMVAPSAAVIMLLVAVALWLMRLSFRHGMMAVVLLAGVIPTLLLQWALAPLWPREDPGPPAAMLARLEQQGYPLAWLGHNYQATFQFAGRLSQSLDEIGDRPHQVCQWQQQHPAGWVIGDSDELPDTMTPPASLHRFPWRGHQLMILPAAPWCDISSGTVQHQQDDMP